MNLKEISIFFQFKLKKHSIITFEWLKISREKINRKWKQMNEIAQTNRQYRIAQTKHSNYLDLGCG